MDNKNLKILFATNDSIALETLKSVCGKFNVMGVLSGKGRADIQLVDFAKTMQIPLFTFEQLKQPERDVIAGTGANFLLSFSISRIFGPKFLSLFSKGTMNIHPSDLPLLRGPSPIQYSILNGFEKSAISFQKISQGMDEGDIYHKVPFEILPSDNTAALREKISFLSSGSICHVLENCLDSAVVQTGEASYSSQIFKQDGRIDFQKDTALTILRKIKAYCIWPKCYCNLDNELIFFEDAGVLSNVNEKAEAGQILGFDAKSNGILIATIDGVLCVKRLRRDKRKSLQAVDFYNGNRNLFVKKTIFK